VGGANKYVTANKIVSLLREQNFIETSPPIKLCREIFAANLLGPIEMNFRVSFIILLAIYGACACLSDGDCPGTEVKKLF
jgi:hypothetical protein